MSRDEMQLVDVDVMIEKLRVIRRVADAERLALVINARTDGYLKAIGEPAGRFDEAVRRANAYREAGADCLFVPGVTDAETIGRLVRAIHGAVPRPTRSGASAWPGSAWAPGRCGPPLSLLRGIAAELAAHGTYGDFHTNTLSRAEVDRLFGK